MTQIPPPEGGKIAPLGNNQEAVIQYFTQGREKDLERKALLNMMNAMKGDNWTGFQVIDFMNYFLASMVERIQRGEAVMGNHRLAGCKNSLMHNIATAEPAKLRQMVLSYNS